MVYTERRSFQKEKLRCEKRWGKIHLKKGRRIFQFIRQARRSPLSRPHHFLPGRGVQKFSFQGQEKVKDIKKNLILPWLYQLIFHINKRECVSPKLLSSFIYIWKVCFWHFSQSVGTINLHIVLLEAAFLLDLSFSFCSQEINSCHFHLKSCGNWLHRHCEAPFYGLKLSLMVLLVSSTSRKKSLDPSGQWLHTEDGLAQVCRSVGGESQNTPLWWLILAIWYLTFFQCHYFAVKGTFERGFVRCHQFHFRIWLSVRTGNVGSIFCSSCLRQTDLFYERLNNVDHTIPWIYMKAFLQADIFW